MVIVKLFGGLGNQMFQYAFGRHMAIKNKSRLKLDLSFYDEEKYRRYELGHFKIAAEIATRDEIDSIKRKHFSQINTLKRKFIDVKPQFVHQKGMQFDPGYFNTKRDVYLDGYWQSEKFFAGSAGLVKKDFQFITEPSQSNRQLLSAIKEVTAVSLHIRRGDFLSNESFNKIHGLCTLDYYERAIDLIGGQISRAVIFVFSDDIAWAKHHLKTHYEMVFVDINDDRSAYEDLRLMSSCKHHILANSSFSWWGAWLNPDPGKIIVAPGKWFSDPELNAQAKSIIPESWIVQ